MCDNERKLHESSFAYVAYHLEETNNELFINTDTLSNLFYILSNRLTLNTEQVLEKMQFVHEIFTLVSIDPLDVEMALELCIDSKSKHKDYEDAMQYVCAKKVDADLIVTNDNGFVSLDIEIKNTK